MSHHLDIRGGVDSLGIFFVDHPTEVANRFRCAGGRTIGDPQSAAFQQWIILETADVEGPGLLRPSLARVAINATRPMLRVALLV